MFFVLFVFVFVFFYFLLIYFILALCEKNNLVFVNTLQANPDFSGTLQEYIQLDFGNFYYKLYFREMEIWDFIFFIQFAYILFFFFLFFLYFFFFVFFSFFFIYFFNFILFISDFLWNFARKRPNFSSTLQE